MLSAGMHASACRAKVRRMRPFLPQFAVVLLCCSFALAQVPSAADALALEQQQKWGEAAEVWKPLTERNPKDAAASASFGLDLARQQKYVEAVSAYRKALQLNPKLPGLQLNLGLAVSGDGFYVFLLPRQIK